MISRMPTSSSIRPEIKMDMPEAPVSPVNAPVANAIIISASKKAVVTVGRGIQGCVCVQTGPYGQRRVQVWLRGANWTSGAGERYVGSPHANATIGNPLTMTLSLLRSEKQGDRLRP